MKAKKYIESLELDISKVGGEKVLPLHVVCAIMESYAFEAWKSGENNGRKNLSALGDLDVKGSSVDFNKWLLGQQY